MLELRPLTTGITTGAPLSGKSARKNAAPEARPCPPPRDTLQLAGEKEILTIQRPVKSAPEPKKAVEPTVPALKAVDPLAMMRVDELKKAYPQLTGKGVGVAVIDSGFNYPGQTPEFWKDFADGFSRLNDPTGHGTMVAGDIRQAAPQADLIALKVADQNGSLDSDAVLKAMQWVLEHKDEYRIKVVNLSLGVVKRYPLPYELIEQAVSRLTEAGVLVVCAAGNDGPDIGSIDKTPNDHPQALTVGGSENPEQLLSCSSRGPTENGKHKPDLVAPGAFIKSWAAPNSELLKKALEGDRIRAMSRQEALEFMEKPLNLTNLGLSRNILSRPEDERILALKNAAPKMFMAPDGQMAAREGTSFSAPLVSGIAALLAQLKPEASPEELKAALTAGAKPMPGYSPDDQGAGFVDAKASADKLLEKEKKSPRN